MYFLVPLCLIMSKIQERDASVTTVRSTGRKQEALPASNHRGAFCVSFGGKEISPNKFVFTI